MECKNCDHPLLEIDHYCRVCGAKVIRKRLTLKNLWVEFSEKFFNIENTLLKTYVALFTKPGEVIDGYNKGVRKKYLGVFNYFALAVTLSGIQLFILRKFFPESLDISVFTAQNVPEGTFNVDWVYDYYSLIVLVNLPIYALMAYLVFYTLKRYNFTEHLVSMTYIITQYSITSAFIITPLCMLGNNFYIIGSLFNLLLLGYTAYCYKKTLKLSWEGILLRTLLFLGIAIGFLILQSLIQLLVMWKSGSLQEMIDAEKTKRGLSYMASSFMNWTS
ncbi:MAG TPA: DUF3667 domain-containing protein [Flavobacteriaceae bacterium]|nr:DUF3667 domain-containing protein [Flavobacteriaceae bacterium]MCB9213623.1 DUF3667 domain-containing protein [Alteromonas sp.]HPF12124.1 DUF3667 domain-containing protein [Flavobacteriaceae bacterium]HQU21445.1 DUF3667 domain-containing protein [Flavobacteriaceae bacterium]HQU65595.1 DUF3667 domain-containing protein [Flavobacteriaceae bacterium]